MTIIGMLFNPMNIYIFAYIFSDLYISPQTLFYGVVYDVLKYDMGTLNCSLFINGAF